MAIVEVVVYIHGVSFSKKARPHTDEYDLLHNGIGRYLPDDALWPKKYCGVEWGSHQPSDPSPSSQALLTTAQRKLGARIMRAVDKQSDLTFNLARLIMEPIRNRTFYGFGDLFYYVSADGKLAVRNAVASQITKFISKQTVSRNDQLSLTILGHSAGSVIAFDFLFYLFSQSRKAASFAGEATEGMTALEKRVKAGSLRLRRLVTFGSPIAFTALRSDHVLRLLSENGRLDPEDYGLASNLRQAQPLKGPRWINIWEKDDLASWPVAPLMKATRAVIDKHPDVSDLLSTAHHAYWGSRDVHKIIGKEW